MIDFKCNEKKKREKVYNVNLSTEISFFKEKGEKEAKRLLE